MTDVVRGAALTASASASEAPAATAAAPRAARAVVVAMHSALRAIRLYPVENVAVQRALADLTAATDAVLQAGATCELRRVGDYLFVN